MSGIVPNQGLFRMYAVAWVAAASMTAMVTLAVTGLSPEGIMAHLLVGAFLWGIDMLLTGARPEPGHGASHAILVAALALVWPLVLAGIIVFLVAGVVHGLRSDRQAA
ncbi:hypothetical protein GCM10009837_07510 [Streptomyces durmitorensis]|uniref:SPW repeat-containing protein n=1 Tax=Streptomyces durmitorensis TaxID=319947 RepID=A0ABY4PN35_9ACTN|nr:hypothetical protein [Streptomyces durmitorensis]UQT54358.1 hypothetical protein M4V62_04245 [Streptomyces durmitorensis]